MHTELLKDLLMQFAHRCFLTRTVVVRGDKTGLVARLSADNRQFFPPPSSLTAYNSRTVGDMANSETFALCVYVPAYMHGANYFFAPIGTKAESI